MVSHERRNDVVRDLPLYIQGNIERRTALYDDVYNIARTCLQYADGMQALVAAIRKREGPTVGVQQLEALL
jgi:type VI protein secretion system component VasA